VSFICDACGNTVKKTQVEKHYTTVCRNCSVLSCLDCGVDFPGDAYITHTSCVTEAEKYQGHLYQAKDKENKGETKQKEWLKSVHGTSNTTSDPKLRSLLKKLSAYSNIPRKKKKFDNFCKNSVNVYDSKTLDQLWELFTGTSGNNVGTGNDKENGEKCSNENSSQHEPSTSIQESTSEDTSNECKGEVSSDSQPIEKKKKKKKRIEEVNEVVPEQVQDETVTKKKKKKKTKTTESDINGDGALGDSESCNGSNKEVKKSKKSKKTKEAETTSITTVNCTETRKIGKKSKMKDTDVDGNPNKIVKLDENGENTEVLSLPVTPNGKFNWHKTIKLLLKESEDGDISLKKLQKKVLSAYQEHGLDHRASTMTEAVAMFDKKVKSYPKAKIVKDRVKLVK